MYFIRHISIIFFALILVVHFPVIIAFADESGNENVTVVSSFPGTPEKNGTVVASTDPPDEIAQQNTSPPEDNQTPSPADLIHAFTGWYDKGVNASNKGNYQAASEAFAAALRINKTSSDAQMRYATTLTVLGRDNEALLIYQNLLNQTSVDDSAILVPYGKTLNAVGDYEAALSVLINGTVRYPDDQEAWNQLAAAYAGLSRYEEALTSVRRSLQISPENAGGWGQLGTVLYGQGRFYEAIAALEKSISLGPDENAYLITLGDSWVALNRYQEATEVYLSALEKNPNHTQTLHKLGDLYAKNGAMNTSAEMYARASGEGPIETEALRENLPVNQTQEVPNLNETKGENNQSQLEDSPNTTPQ
jgi:Flp pilus assembly protein TadD